MTTPVFPASPEALAAMPDVFTTPNALAINRARMEHLRSLRVLKKGDRVLDVGCGPGLLARYLMDWGCEVVGLDARPDNTRHCPEGMQVVTHDVHEPFPKTLGVFDAVFCYGLIYHLRDPMAGLRHMALVDAPILLLESIVTDSQALDTFTQPGFHGPNQALDGMDSYPSPTWFAHDLRVVGYRYVYTPSTPPDYPDYLWEPLDSREHQRDGHDLRMVFVASRKRLVGKPLRRA